MSELRVEARMAVATLASVMLSQVGWTMRSSTPILLLMMTQKRKRGTGRSGCSAR